MVPAPACCEPCIATEVRRSRIYSAQEDIVDECCSPCKATRAKTIHRHDHQVTLQTVEDPWFWKETVVAAVASGPKYGFSPKEAHVTELDDGYHLKAVLIQNPTSWHSWLEWLDGYGPWFKIEAYTEFVHRTLLPSWISLAGVHEPSVFTILETSSSGQTDNSRRFLCIERNSSNLEITIGQKGEPMSVLVDFVRKYRSSGRRRHVHRWTPIEEGERQLVGAEAGLDEITVLDLLRWLNGPIAENWFKTSSSSAVFAESLQTFLREGSPHSEDLDHELVVQSVSENGSDLQLASLPLRNDPDVVLAAIGHDPDALQYASLKLRGSKPVVVAATKGNGMALRFATKELQDDRDVVAHAVRQNGRALLFASERLRSDRQLVLVAIEQDPFALQWASDSLRADKDIMMLAVSIDGTTLRYASEELRADWGLVRAAVMMDFRALRLASKELQADRKLIELARQEVQVPKRKKYKPKLVKNDDDIRIISGNGGSDSRLVQQDVSSMSTAEIRAMKPWEQFNDRPEEISEDFSHRVHGSFRYNF